MTQGQHPPRPAHAEACLTRVRAIALSFPQAMEKLSHGASTFYTHKVFAVFGGSLKGDHYAPLARNALLFLPDGAERETLVQEGRFFVPAYYGPAGWPSWSRCPTG